MRFRPEARRFGCSILFDTVAVYLAMSEKLLVMEDIPLSVTADGLTAPDPKGKRTHCAVSWKDLAAFESFLASRLR